MVLARQPRTCNFIQWKDMKIVYKRWATLFRMSAQAAQISGGVLVGGSLVFLSDSEALLCNMCLSITT